MSNVVTGVIDRFGVDIDGNTVKYNKIKFTSQPKKGDVLRGVTAVYLSFNEDNSKKSWMHRMYKFNDNLWPSIVQRMVDICEKMPEVAQVLPHISEDKYGVEIFYKAKDLVNNKAVSRRHMSILHYTLYKLINNRCDYDSCETIFSKKAIEHFIPLVKVKDHDRYIPGYDTPCDDRELFNYMYSHALLYKDIEVSIYHDASVKSFTNYSVMRELKNFSKIEKDITNTVFNLNSNNKEDIQVDEYIVFKNSINKEIRDIIKGEVEYICDINGLREVSVPYNEDASAVPSKRGYKILADLDDGFLEIFTPSIIESSFSEMIDVDTMSECMYNGNFTIFKNGYINIYKEKRNYEKKNGPIFTVEKDNINSDKFRELSIHETVKLASGYIISQMDMYNIMYRLYLNQN